MRVARAPRAQVYENAVDALANLAAEPAARDEIVSEGGIAYLVQLLETEGRKCKTFAATALARLSKDHEPTQTAIAKAGAIASLVALLDGKEGLEAQEASAGAILALAEHEDNRLKITESGGIGFLVMLLGSTMHPMHVYARAHPADPCVCTHR